MSTVDDTRLLASIGDYEEARQRVALARNGLRVAMSQVREEQQAEIPATEKTVSGWNSERVHSLVRKFTDEAMAHQELQAALLEQATRLMVVNVKMEYYRTIASSRS